MSLISTVLLALYFLQVKHLIIDWIWQPEYECKNKGTFLHFGGIRHALKNALGTALVFSVFFGSTIGPLCFLIIPVDFIIHYCIDYWKTNFNESLGLEPSKRGFWWLLGFDQFLHQITYIYLIFLFVL